MGSGPPPTAEEFAALFRSGRYAELEQRARELLRTDPDSGLAWKSLGVACAALGRHEEALAAKLRATQLAPRDAEARCNLANALAAGGRASEAEAAFRRAIALNERFVNAWSGLAALLRRQARLDDAIACLQRVAQLQPDSAHARNELGNLLRENARMSEARTAYEQALALRPGYPEALSNLGNTLADLGLPHEAERRYRAALALAPDRAEIHSNLGNLLKDQGRLAEAQAAYRRSVELDPRFDGAWSNLLLSMNHDAAVAPAAAKREAMRFGAVLAQRAGAPLAQPGAAPVGPPLRVGFVSGDLRNHPVGYFLEGPLAHLAAQGLELYAYPTMLREDELSQRIKPHFRRWQCIAGSSDEAAARLIHADGIDVLVDLSGHTAHNRLGVFAWRPAPVQASWLGYFATTGLPTMDWLIADRGGVKPQDEDDFTERLWFLPETRLCFSAPADAPLVAALPAAARGCVTFGSFQNLGKINDAVLQCWATVLQAVPCARLRVQNAQLGDAHVQEDLRARMQRCGMDPRRVGLHGRQPRRAYLHAHAAVDMLLDTFPYPGGTTTCEALWMGVPTLTLAGDRMLSRQGASLLQAAGLPGWIARDEAEYVSKAVEHAGALAALARLRAGLREQVASSPLFDAPRFAAHLAGALRGMAGL